MRHFIGLLVLIASFVCSPALPAAAQTVLPPPVCEVGEDAPECVIVPNVQSGSISDYLQSTFYLIANETNGPMQAYQGFYNQANELMLRDATPPTPPGISQAQYLQTWAGYEISGTLQITATAIFSVQVIDPRLGSCANTIDLRCMTVYVSPASTTYTVQNTEFQPFTFVHDVYRNGVLIASDTHTFSGFERRSFVLPVEPVSFAARTSNEAYRVEVYRAVPRSNSVWLPLLTRR